MLRAAFQAGLALRTGTSENCAKFDQVCISLLSTLLKQTVEKLGLKRLWLGKHPKRIKNLILKIKCSDIFTSVRRSVKDGVE